MFDFNYNAQALLTDGGIIMLLCSLSHLVIAPWLFEKMPIEINQHCDLFDKVGKS